MTKFKSNEDFYNQVMNHKVVYALMYWPGYLKDKPIKPQIIDIETKKLVWSYECFIFRWGWPGPDINVYKMDDYGKGWAFTEKEILEAWNA